MYIIITLLILIAFLASGVLFFIFHTPVSCDDGVQNGLELGVDCSGSCPNVCPVDPKKLLDVWVRPFPLADGVYSAVAYIENQNADLYVPSVQFEIVLYDADGSVITRASQNTPIMPNGVTPIFVPHVVTGEREAVSATFRFIGEPVFVPHSGSYRFSFSDTSVDASDGSFPRVSALVTNTGDRAVREVDFVVVVYDEDAVAIAASRTFERDMQPGETRALQYTWVRPFELRRGLCPGGLCVREVKQVEIIPVVLKR